MSSEIQIYGVQSAGSRGGEVPPGFDFRFRCHVWVEFVIGSLLAPRGFPLHQKTNTAKFQFDPECTDSC